MHTAAEYRKYANECIESAEVATSEAARMQFLELSYLWMVAANLREQQQWPFEENRRCYSRGSTIDEKPPSVSK
jgi:hypothetical protein